MAGCNASGGRAPPCTTPTGPVLVVLLLTLLGIAHVPARAGLLDPADISIRGRTSSPGVKLGHELRYSSRW